MSVLAWVKVSNTQFKMAAPRVVDRINQGKAASQSICPCSTLPQSEVDSINTLKNYSIAYFNYIVVQCSFLTEFKQIVLKLLS